MFFRPFLLFRFPCLYPFSLSFSRLEVAPQIQLTFVRALLASPTHVNDICSLQTRSPEALNIPKCVCAEPGRKRIFVYLEPMKRAQWLQMSSRVC